MEKQCWSRLRVGRDALTVPYKALFCWDRPFAQQPAEREARPRRDHMEDVKYGAKEERAKGPHELDLELERLPSQRWLPSYGCCEPLPPLLGGSQPFSQTDFPTPCHSHALV